MKYIKSTKGCAELLFLAALSLILIAMLLAMTGIFRNDRLAATECAEEFNKAADVYAKKCNLKPGDPVLINDLVKAELCPTKNKHFDWGTTLMTTYGNYTVATIGHVPNPGEAYATISTIERTKPQPIYKDDEDKFALPCGKRTTVTSKEIVADGSLVQSINQAAFSYAAVHKLQPGDPLSLEDLSSAGLIPTNLPATISCSGIVPKTGKPYVQCVQ